MTRRIASAAAVAAVAAVVVAAIVDQVRPKPAEPLDSAAAAQLAELGVTGRLVYTDPDCKLHALSLPRLKPTRLPAGRAGCEISLSPGGREVAPASVHWGPGGRRCGGVCAWRGGERTFALGREIVSARGVLVSRRELERAARTHPNAPDDRAAIEDLRVRDLVWNPAGELVTLIAARYVPGPPDLQTTVAAFLRGRLAWHRPYFGGYDRLVVSSRGDVLLEPAVRTQSTFFAGLDPAGPIAWSPDGKRLAVATRASVFVVDGAAGRRVRIPVTVRDLAWG